MIVSVRHRVSSAGRLTVEGGAVLGGSGVIAGRTGGAAAQAPRRGWGRVFGQRSTWHAAPGDVYRDGPDHRSDLYAVQVGIDLARDAS